MASVIPQYRHIFGTTKVYARGRTTIPDKVRQVLDLTDKDSVVWYEDFNGRVCVANSAKPSMVKRTL